MNRIRKVGTNRIHTLGSDLVEDCGRENLVQFWKVNETLFSIPDSKQTTTNDFQENTLQYMNIKLLWQFSLIFSYLFLLHILPLTINFNFDSRQFLS